MSHAFDATILREYDIRGIIGETLGADDARAIGRTFGSMLREAGGSRVAVGYDGRVSSPMLEHALVEGLTASGCNVVRIGLGATPMLYYAEASDHDIDGGCGQLRARSMPLRGEKSIYVSKLPAKEKSPTEAGP